MTKLISLCCRFVVAGSNDDHYVVELKDRNSSCECPDHVYRHRFCKHMWLVFMYLGMFEREQRLEWHQVTCAMTCAVVVHICDNRECWHFPTQHEHSAIIYLYDIAKPIRIDVQLTTMICVGIYQLLCHHLM